MANVALHYRDGNRAFLQAFMARGALTFEDARPILAAIFSADENQLVTEDKVTRQDFDSYVAAATEAISFFDYEIRSSVHQATSKRVFALVNTTSDPTTQLATTYAPDELSFVKRVLDAMFDTYNTPRMECMCLDSMQVIKLARPPKSRHDNPSHHEEAEEENGDGGGATQAQTQTQAPTDKGLKHSEVEAMAAKLVSEGWLEKSREGFYSLSPRALMELRTWLVESFNDAEAAAGDWQRIKFCEACKDIITQGQRCAARDCNMRLHDMCGDAYWRARREKKCPAMRDGLDGGALCWREGDHKQGGLPEGTQAERAPEGERRGRSHEGGGRGQQ
ncbi:conserved hypothetical protein [Verticillium alfalfae VaMs.102]|uniref:Non-structural maintenance of chromosomes element 1 homolog n=1 Tax=Verticillium alfalfae (strain VaMs.102 / ATCC MYA-4576 / FGSC 10136) TaxID=526221 RepID=C9SAU4_VERA1|nr:conserved hypothetical protein [Verticillium alfalfae VaMs.102]EEY15518.1 conserved hypothetical protein [Verticillium alfalfae VaMs.102]